ncbi:MAG: nucleoside-triphosphatase [Promethearchaeota archaeon]
MNTKILITGPPRSGKSTLITRLIDYFSKKQITIYGFLTPEVRKGKHRIGFDIEDISTKERKKLARINQSNSDYRLGKYSVSMIGLQWIISKMEDIRFTKEDLLIIDEIGKMELFSKKFQDFILYVFSSDLTIVATVGLKIKHPIKDHLLRMPDVNLFTLDHKNFQNIFQEIISLI